MFTVREDGGDSEGEGDDGESVEIDEEQNSERVGVVNDGAVARRNEEDGRDEQAADGQRRRELEHPRHPVQVALHAHQFHRLLHARRKPRLLPGWVTVFGRVYHLDM